MFGGGQDFLRRELAVLDDGVQLVGDTGRRRRKRAVHRLSLLRPANGGKQKPQL
jgi:hypothetical protein